MPPFAKTASTAAAGGETHADAAASFSVVPAAGFFGKIPSTGDFVARGLPDGFRLRWDRWVTAHLAPRQRNGAAWPSGGLRFRLTSGGRAAAGAAVPSRDSVGRQYPLSLILTGDRLGDPAALDEWCDAAAALDTSVPPDALWQAIIGLPAVPPAESLPPDALLLWSRGKPPLSADPSDPGPALDLLFGPVPD